jgi:NAD(P)H-nitrite reductase large subunit
MRHVIVGNGPAGVLAAETLRQADPASRVVLVGDEPAPPYSRMAIPYLLAGKIDERGTFLRKDADHYARRGIELRTARAVRLDGAARSVALADGTALPFDRLLLAGGSRPIQPKVPGLDLPHVHPCWTLADARAILARAHPGARVVQIGAGFIGCIIMEALVRRGTRLAVVEMGNRLVPRMMTETAGTMIRQWCEGKGVRVLTSARVEGIGRGGGETLQVALAGGTTLPADLVIVAAGVAPAIDWLAGSGVHTAAGVLVDDAMATSVAGVYAAGDVTQQRDLLTGDPVVNAIQPNAADQARVAALNMAGRPARSQGSLAINVLDTLGLVASSVGQWMGVAGGDHAELVDRPRHRYLRLEFRDDRLVGANALGLTEHVGVLRGLIQTRARLGAWKARLVADPTRIVEAYLARASALA